MGDRLFCDTGTNQPKITYSLVIYITNNLFSLLGKKGAGTPYGRVSSQKALVINENLTDPSQELGLLIRP